MRKRRFWFHYNKIESAKQGRNVLTLHWKNKCHKKHDLECKVPTEVHHKKDQPRCVVRGWCNEIKFETDYDGELLINLDKKRVIIK